MISGTPTSHELRTALDRFRNTDWTFANRRTNIGLHSIHPYPAKFVPQIPRHLVEIFQPVVNGPVLDPFCGSGTTLVECQQQGVPSFGIDVNPLAALISKVKTHPPVQPITPVASQLVAEALTTTDCTSPNIPRLAHWFCPDAAVALSKLTKGLAQIPESSARDALRIALSRIIVRVSRQESDTRYAAVDRVVSEPEVYRQFVESARSTDKIFLEEHGNLFRLWAPSEILEKDILTVKPSDLPYKFGLIITSPPYPNAYEYWLYHKYRMYWLGQDPIAVRRAEIGARPRYFGRNPESAEDFRRQMSLCFGLFREITLPEAVACVVVGRSIIRGETIDNAALLRSAASQHGFRAVASARRDIPSTRKSFNPAHGGINSETILVFEKQK